MSGTIFLHNVNVAIAMPTRTESKAAPTHAGVFLTHHTEKQVQLA